MENSDEVLKWTHLDLKGKLDGLHKLMELAERKQELVDDWGAFIISLTTSTTSTNPRLVEGCLDTLSASFKSRACSASSYSKLINPAIISGLGHIKFSVNKATINLVQSVCFAAAEEKCLSSSFLPQLFRLLKHDMWRVRAGILESLTKICECDYSMFCAELPVSTIMSDALPSLASCMDDAQPTVRQNALNLTSLVVSASEKRNKVMSTLEACGLRQTHLVALRRMVGDKKHMSEGKENKKSCSNQHSATSLSKIKSSLTSTSTHHGTSGSVVKPLVIETDAEVSREFTKISTDLSNVDDWMKRMKALNRLHALALAAAQRDSFVHGLKGVADAVTAQIKDLRSTLSKEACFTVGAVSLLMADLFSQFADIFVTPLISLTIQAIAVIAESGLKSLTDIIRCTTNGFPNMLKKLTIVAAKKKGQDRATALSLVAKALQTWNAESSAKLMRIISELEPMLKDRLKDADPSVRSAARQVTVELERTHPEATTRLLVTLDLVSQKEVALLRHARQNEQGDQSQSTTDGSQPAFDIETLNVSEDNSKNSSTKFSELKAQRRTHLGSLPSRNLDQHPAQSETVVGEHQKRMSSSSAQRESRDFQGGGDLKKTSRRMSLSSGPCRVSIPDKSEKSHLDKSRRMSLGHARIQSKVPSLESSIAPDCSIFTKSVPQLTSVNRALFSESDINMVLSEDGEPLFVVEEEQTESIPPAHREITSKDELISSLTSIEIIKPEEELSAPSPTLCSMNSISPTPPSILSSLPSFSSTASQLSPKTPCAPSLSYDIAKISSPSIAPPNLVLKHDIGDDKDEKIIEEQLATTVKLDNSLIQQAREIGAGSFKGSWADRLKFAHRLSGQGGCLRGFSVLTNASEKVAIRSAVHALLGDLHEKVMTSTLAAVVEEFKVSGVLCEDLIEVTLPRAAYLLFDHKETTMSLARQLLDCIRTFPDIGFVLKLCSSHLTDGPDKVRHAIIEFACPLIPLASFNGCFSTPKSFLLKNTVLRLAVVAALPIVSNSASKAKTNGGSGGPTAARDRSALKEVAVDALDQLCKAVDPVMVVSQIRASITLEQQHALRPLLSHSPAVASAWTSSEGNRDKLSSPSPNKKQGERQQDILETAALLQKSPISSVVKTAPSISPISSPRKLKSPQCVPASLLPPYPPPPLLESRSMKPLAAMDLSSKVNAIIESIDSSNCLREKAKAIQTLNGIIASKRMPLNSFTAVLISLLDAITLSPIRNPGEEVAVDELLIVSAAFSALKSLAIGFAPCFDGSLQVVMRKLIRLKLPWDSVASMEDTLSTLVVSISMLQEKGYGVESVACAHVLLPHLENENTSHSATKILTPLISRIPSPDLLALLSGTSLLSSLQQTLTHENCDTRKVAVMALVEVCFALGEIANPLLSSKFSTNEMKLITMYVDNNQKQLGN